jgi:hypothetical protein
MTPDQRGTEAERLAEEWGAKYRELRYAQGRREALHLALSLNTEQLVAEFEKARAEADRLDAETDEIMRQRNALYSDRPL